MGVNQRRQDPEVICLAYRSLSEAGSDRLPVGNGIIASVPVSAKSGAFR